MAHILVCSGRATRAISNAWNPILMQSEVCLLECDNRRFPRLVVELKSTQEVLKSITTFSLLQPCRGNKPYTL